jgi:hypothetical protein
VPKVRASMLVTPGGIDSCLKFAHLWKALSPMLVSPDGSEGSRRTREPRYS